MVNIQLSQLIEELFLFFAFARNDEIIDYSISGRP